MGGGDIEGGGGGGGGEGLAAPSLVQRTDPNGLVTSVNGVVTRVEQVVVGVEGGKLGHTTPHNNDFSIPPPSLGHHHHQQLLAMMHPPPPPPLTTTHSHHLLSPPPSSSTFNHHHQQQLLQQQQHHHHQQQQHQQHQQHQQQQHQQHQQQQHQQQQQQQLASAAPHFQLPNQLPRYLHVLPSHSPPPSSIFPYHQQHHIDFSLPQQQQQQSHSPFSPHSHLVVSPPSTLVFSSSPTPAVPTPDQPTSTSAGSKKRGGSGGLNKICGVSPALQAIVGEPAMPRTQIVKQLWAYIRKNNLQDPSNKRKIICNDELRLVFETDCTDMFKMNKLLAKHITPLETNKILGPEPKKIKTEDSGNQPAEKDQPPVILSDPLANFFGIAEKEMLQSEAVQRVMDYIKLNNLEDTLDSKAIQCDSKLQDLFGSESVSVLAIPELLEHHFFKQPEKVLGTDCDEE